MRLYRFSPIRNKQQLMQAIEHIHYESYKLCNQVLDRNLPNSGNIGIFCHYEEEYEFLTRLRKKLTIESENFKQKYFKLKEPIVIKKNGDIPETTYTHLYIRRTDPYRGQVGDLDFYLDPKEYKELKKQVDDIRGARLFVRPDLDMIELYDPDVDVLVYVSTHRMTELVRTKQT